MNLRSTTVSSTFGFFTGRSPGVLSQEIRAMDSTPTTTILLATTHQHVKEID
jgi:hypothetical protein